MKQKVMLHAEVNASSTYVYKHVAQMPAYSHTYGTYIYVCMFVSFAAHCHLSTGGWPQTANHNEVQCTHQQKRAHTIIAYRKMWQSVCYAVLCTRLMSALSEDALHFVVANTMYYRNPHTMFARLDSSAICINFAFL